MWSCSPWKWVRMSAADGRLSSTSPMLMAPISFGNCCHRWEDSSCRKSVMFSRGGVMKNLYLPFNRLWARSHPVGVVWLVGRISVWCGINGEVAFLFWATCSTGATKGIGSSTWAARWGREGPLDGCQGAAVQEPDRYVAPFPLVLEGEVGLRVPDGFCLFPPPPPTWTALGFFLSSFLHKLASPNPGYDKRLPKLHNIGPKVDGGWRGSERHLARYKLHCARALSSTV